MFFKPAHIPTLLLALAAFGSLQAQPRESGGILIDPAGLTLYVFDNDLTMPGKSVCINACALNWTYMAAKDTDKPQGDHSIIVRDDGQKQWAYKGRPLYRFVNDNKPGDRIGDGMRGAWHVARP
jgi:predicted lipoprotein with Yx(FWY)xxD motif